MFITDALVEQIVQALAAHLWRRPELAPLRQPVEQVLNAGAFRMLTRQAFETFSAQVSDALPDYFDAGFIAMPAVQAALAGYIVQGKPIDPAELARLYGKRHLSPADAPDASTQIDGYLKALRETFALHPTYGPILLARDVQTVVIGINNLHDDLSEVKTLLRELLAEPAIKALVERKHGTHIFLSYSRQNLTAALEIRNRLEDAGHIVWQDSTAIKGGADWIDSIEDGIKRAYAVVTVISEEARASRWVRLEFLEAQRREKYILPVQIDGCEIPLEMLDLNVKKLHPDFAAGMRDVLADLAAYKPAQPDAPAPLPQNPRDIELDYLNRVLLEHSVWQEVYTPMGGVAKISQQPDKPAIRRRTANIEPSFSVMVQAAFQQEAKLVEEPFEDITVEVGRVRQLVILGDPGSGKTTTLWKLAADYAQRAKADPAAPLPIFLRLGALHPLKSVRDQLQEQLGALNLDALLEHKRLALLIDALNELPELNRAAKVAEVRVLVERAQRDQTIAVVTCRELDYQGELDLGIQRQARIAPLDPARIRQFCLNHLPDDGEQLFWQIAGEAARRFWAAWQREEKGDFAALWESEAVPGSTSRAEDEVMQTLRRAMRGEARSRSMLALARNPYMLFMMTEVYTETASLPPNRGKLFDLFTDYLLLKREHLPTDEAQTLRERLADMAYRMQDEALGTAIGRDLALQHLSEDQLYRALSANLLDGSDNMRFTHQLLQEYFAAQRLNREMRRGTPAAQFWQPDQWWQPAGWEETAVLLMGLYSDDTTPVIEWLRDAQPELTARCIHESGAHTPAAAVQALKPRWLPRLTDVRADPDPRARAAVGRALGHLNLDDRPGVGLRPDGLPDIAWVEIPAGEFIYQQNTKLSLPTFYISRYLVTYAQFQAFVEAPDYHDDRWWAGMPEEGKNFLGTTFRTRYLSEQSFKFANHPRENVTWYQAVAFTRWLTAQYTHHNLWDNFVGTPSMASGGRTRSIASLRITLPTEQQWEKAARGTDGRAYPYGNTFDAAMGNTRETGIGQTSAVGIFPGGASPYGVLDMSGNVWEWCLNKYESPEDTDTSGTDVRVLRGGSWNNVQVYARAALRHGNLPSNRNDGWGFRLVVVGVPITKL